MTRLAFALIALLAGCGTRLVVSPTPMTSDAPEPRGDTWGQIFAWQPATAAPPPEGWIVESAPLDEALRVSAEILSETWEASGEGWQHCYQLHWDRSVEPDALRAAVSRAGHEPRDLEAFRDAESEVVVRVTRIGFACACFRHPDAEAAVHRVAFLRGLPGIERFEGLVELLSTPGTVRYTSVAGGRRGFDVLWDLDGEEASATHTDWLAANGFESASEQGRWRRADGARELEVAASEIAPDHLRFSAHAYTADPERGSPSTGNVAYSIEDAGLPDVARMLSRITRAPFVIASGLGPSLDCLAIEVGSRGGTTAGGAIALTRSAVADIGVELVEQRGVYLFRPSADREVVCGRRGSPAADVGLVVEPRPQDSRHAGNVELELVARATLSTAASAFEMATGIPIRLDDALARDASCVSLTIAADEPVSVERAVALMNLAMSDANVRVVRAGQGYAFRLVRGRSVACPAP